jgi:hypothetical protein
MVHIPEATNVTPITLKKRIKPTQSVISITKQLNDAILAYVIPRMDNERTRRQTRITRYGRVDKQASGWQKLSKEDTIRQDMEHQTGRPQGISGILPVIDTQVEDTAAFFTEIFVPAAGAFLVNQGKSEKVTQAKELAELLAGDAQAEGYYTNVSVVMRQLLKYNVGGFTMTWKNGDPNSVGTDQMGGNRFEALDLYNLFYDPSVTNIAKLRTEGEWYAIVKHVNRMHLIKNAQNGLYSQIDKVLANRSADKTQYNANYYKFPPVSTGLNNEGLDEGTSQTAGGQGADWEGYGASLASESGTDIPGHEMICMEIWLNPNQFDITNDETLQLFRLKIVDKQWLVSIELVQGANQLQIFTDYLRKDEMMNAMRSYAESMRVFQRHMSFMANIAIAAERGNVYNQRIYDPQAIDGERFKSGETAGSIPLKTPGRDVRTAIMNLNQTNTDTSSMYAAIGHLSALMKEFFPNQGLPSQIAGLDRAVTSQVAALMQGATRRLHKLVKELDSTLMGPMRIAAYRNYVMFHPEASKFSKLTEKDVARLLNSGLGQLNREIAAAAVERMLFTLIQNPNSAAGFDLPGLFAYWSLLLNSGTDLSEFVSPAAVAGNQTAQEPIDPNLAAQQAAGGAPQIQ